MANTVSKLANTATLQTYSFIDEVTNNPAASGSFSLNGSGQYLTVPNINFGLNNFTIEGWFYPTSLGVLVSFWGTDMGSGNNPKLALYVGSATNLYLDNGSGTIVMSVPTTNITTNAWNHIALVRAGISTNQTAIYINGISIATGTLSTNLSTITNPFNIGYIGEAGLNTFSGYISNFRVVNGTAVYTSNFTPSNQPLIAITNTALLLNSPYTNDAFLDSGQNKFTVTNTGAVTSILQTPFNPNGYYSNYFNGSTQYLTAPYVASYNLGNSSFTIEFWVYFNSVASGQRIAGQDNNSSTFTWGFYTTAAGTLNYYLSSTGSAWDLASGVLVGAVATNRWYHVALVRSGATFTPYLNGVAGTPTTSAAALFVSTSVLTLGAVNGGSFFNGYLSNFRIINGQANYTSPFIPPTAPLTSIFSTVFLSCQSSLFKDNSIVNAVMTPIAGVLINSNIQPFSTISYSSNTNIAVSKQYGNGVLQTTGVFDELTMNPNLTGSVLMASASLQYLSTPANFNVSGTTSWTIEGWIYLNTTSNFAMIGGQTAGADKFYIQYNGSTFYVGDSSSNPIQISYSFAVYTWYHIAVVNNAGTLSAYINGVVVGTVSNTLASNQLDNWWIGRRVTAGYYLNGYVTNVRIVKNVAVYTGNFTTPSSPLSVTQSAGPNIAAITSNNTLLLVNPLQTDISDSSVYNNVITKLPAATPPVTTFESPFIRTPTSNSYSYLFSGVSQYLSTNTTTTFAIATGNFTIEAWVYVTSFSSNPTVLSQYTSGTVSAGNWIFAQILSGSIYFTLDGSNASMSYSTPINLNQWYHMALVRNGVAANNVVFYLNGTNVKSTTFANTFGTSGRSTFVGGQSASVGLFAGYISNLRMIVGSAAYTSNFTPPTAPLTSNSTTTMLTCQSPIITDNSSSPLVLSNPGSTSVITSPANPFAGYGYNSYSFSGSGQSISAPANTAFAFGTGDFTFECWAYSADTTGSSVRGIFDTRLTSTSTTGIMLRENSAGFLVYTNNTTLFTTSGKTPNVWQHIALVKISGTITLYVNGVNVGSATSAINLTDNYCRISGFTDTQASPYGYLGYISNARVIKGTGIYTTNFTPSTAPLTVTSQGATASQVSLLTAQSPVITDSSLNALTNILTNTGSVVPNLQNPFNNTGYYSNHFDGTSAQNITISSPPIPSTGPFTFEAWIYTPTSGTQVIYSQYLLSDTNRFTIGIDISSSGYVLSFSQPTAASAQGVTPVPLNQWNHVVFSRDSSNNLRIFLNGLLESTTASYTATLGQNNPRIVGITTTGTPYYFNGYISNLRITNTAVYTASFTVPTTPLTSITGTQLLTCQTPTIVDSSVNAYTLTNNGSVPSPLFQPFPYSKTATVTSNTTVSKLYNTGVMQTINGFDEVSINPAAQGSISLNAASVQYLTAPTSGASSFTFGTGDFTIEFWIYLSSYAASTTQIFDLRPAGTSSTTNYIVIGASPAGVVSTILSGAVITGSTLSLNTWYHIAVVRASGTSKLYVNGSQVGSSVSDSTSYTVGANRPIIGADGNSPSSGFATTGYISNLRVVKGVGIYTGAFTPPTTPLITTQQSGTNITRFINSANTSLLLNTQYNNFLVDSSTNAFTITNNGATTAPTNPFYQGYYSVLFNGSNQYLTSPNINFGLNNFTIEGWFYPTSLGVLVSFWGTDMGSGNNPKLALYVGSATNLYLDNGSGTIVMSVPTTNITTNAWNHIALVRAGTGANQTSMYINGIIRSSATLSTNFSTVTNTFNVGYIGEAGLYSFPGYISNFRIVNGNAVYTSNFIPPTNALTAIANTVLLSCQAPTFADSSNNHVTITVTGSPTISNITPFYPKGY
jgi:hypothetical protein